MGCHRKQKQWYNIQAKLDQVNGYKMYVGDVALLLLLSVGKLKIQIQMSSKCVGQTGETDEQLRCRDQL